MKNVELTGAELAKLEAELAELEGPKRAEMVEAIATARGFGDLSENFEYHAAKNDQGLLERQITLLRAKIKDAVVVDEPAAGATGRVSVGSRVSIADQTGEQMEITISSAGGPGAVSPESPLGRALYGAEHGAAVSVKAPGGAWTARVLGIG